MFESENHSIYINIFIIIDYHLMFNVIYKFHFEFDWIEILFQIFGKKNWLNRNINCIKEIEEWIIENNNKIWD